jgi:hypothetical protein
LIEDQLGAMMSEFGYEPFEDLKRRTAKG